MEPKHFHLVIRFSDNLFSVGDVVSKHNEIVSAYGNVWFGKLGSPLSYRRVDLINNQIMKNLPTSLYLVKGARKKSTAYITSIFEVTRDFPKKESNLIPEYYTEKGIIKFISVWLKIGEIEQIEMSHLKNLRAIHSVFPLEETLAKSSSGYFLVSEGRSVF
jgi:hypothetical protein